MRTITKPLFAVLLGAAFMASCSRPVAYFQPTARQQYKSVQTEAVAVTPAEVAQPAVVETSAPQVVVVAQAATPTEQIAQTKQAVSQVEAYVRNDSKLASNKKLAKRMARVSELLTTASDKAAVPTKVTSPKKISLLERTMLKKIDKNIKSHVAPDAAKAMTSNVRLGLIIGGIGLILLLLGGSSVLGVLGLIGFIIGLVLILIGVINS